MKNKISILTFIIVLFALQIIFAQNTNKTTQYKNYSPCTFYVSLPVQFKLINEYPNDYSPDHCEYIVKTKGDLQLISISSLLNSRFESYIIQDLYKEAINNSQLNIVYKIQKANWFVISGTKKENGNIVYWKRVAGSSFISDLHIEYPKSKKNEIEPYLTKISTSFTSK